MIILTNFDEDSFQFKFFLHTAKIRFFMTFESVYLSLTKLTQFTLNSKISCISVEEYQNHSLRSSINASTSRNSAHKHSYAIRISAFSALYMCWDNIFQKLFPLFFSVKFSLSTTYTDNLNCRWAFMCSALIKHQRTKKSTNSNDDVVEPVAVVQLLMQRVMHFAFIWKFGVKEKKAADLYAPAVCNRVRRGVCTLRYVCLCVCMRVIVCVVREFTWKVPFIQKRNRVTLYFLVAVNRLYKEFKSVFKLHQHQQIEREENEAIDFI